MARGVGPSAEVSSWRPNHLEIVEITVEAADTGATTIAAGDNEDFFGAKLVPALAAADDDDADADADAAAEAEAEAEAEVEVEEAGAVELDDDLEST